MLVLTRHQDEQVMIGDDIKITVISLGAGKVRLGIDAPLSLAVHRREVYCEIHNLPMPSPRPRHDMLPGKLPTAETNE